MKQKVVIKVAVQEQKSRSKALKIVVGLPGVQSTALAGHDQNHIVVTGDRIDAVALTTLLRRKVGSSELVSVGPGDCGGEGDDMLHNPVGGFNDSYNPHANGLGQGYETWNQNPYAYGPGHGYEIRNQNPYDYGLGHGYEIRNQNRDSCSIM